VVARREYSLVCVNVTKLKIKGGGRTPWHMSHVTTPTSKEESHLTFCRFLPNLLLAMAAAGTGSGQATAPCAYAGKRWYAEHMDVFD
jgi:hypothetical protein